MKKESENKEIFEIGFWQYLKTFFLQQVSKILL